MLHRVFELIERRNAEELRRLLRDDGAATRARDDAGRTPLHAAAAAGFGEAVRSLVSAGAPVNALDNRGWTPAFHAVFGNHADIVRALIASDAAVTVADPNGRTLLHTSAGFNKPEITRALLDAGANVNARAIGAATPLHYAAIAGDSESARMLLAAGADVNMICNEEITPLWWAILRDRAAMVSLLLEAGSSPNYTNYAGLSPLALAVSRGNAEIVRSLMDAGADLSYRQPETERTLLHLAALHGHSEVEATLRSEGLGPQARDAEGATPAQLRRRYGHDAISAGVPSAALEPLKIGSGDPEIRAAARYLGGSGWAICTENHVLIFAPPDRGRLPHSASLLSGTITPSDLLDRRALYFVSRSSDDWLPSPLRSDLDALAGVTFVLPTAPDLDVAFRLAEPGEELVIDDVRLLPLGFDESVPSVSYIVCADGLSILHLRDWSFRHPEFERALRRALATVKEFSEAVDLAFLDVPGGRQLVCLPSRRGMHTTIETLAPGRVIPMGHLFSEHVYRQVASDIRSRRPDQAVACVSAPGDVVSVPARSPTAPGTTTR
jgi:ankyrin repeat protein